MYPPMVCPQCARGDLYVIYCLMLQYREKYHSELEKDNQYRTKGDSVDFPLYEFFNKFELTQCCRIELTTKNDYTHVVYGQFAMDKK
jgi:hypothetical protein